MKFIRIGLAAVFAAVLVAHGAAAQDWQKKKDGQQKQPQTQQQQQQPQQRPQAPAQIQGGGSCAPSGFARLSRNCSTNTGGCQRMPESCSRGWCCP